MRYFIDEKKHPAYMQIYSQVREDIVKGYYSYGEKLPSKRGLAEETGVSVITIEHAYALLCDEGYVEGRERSGYVVKFRKKDGFMGGIGEHKEVFNKAHISKRDYGDFPVSVLNKTMRRVMSEQNELLLEKSPNEGKIELRDSIRRYLERNRGIVVETEQIIIGSGSEYLYGLIVELLGTDKVYAIEYPSYKKIEQVYKAKGVKYQSLPLTKSGIKSDALQRTCASVLHTTPYRSFPSGVTATASKRYKYVEWANDGNRFIIEDDFESEFSILKKPTETLFSLSNHDNVIYLNTFSKTISASLRVGYMLLPKRLVNVYHERLGFYSCPVPTIIQQLLSSLIDNGDFERHINRVRRKLRKERATYSSNL